MHAVPKMGPPGPIFGTVFRFIFVKFFCIRVEEAQCFGVNRNFVAFGDRKGNCRPAERQRARTKKTLTVIAFVQIGKDLYDFVCVLLFWKFMVRLEDSL